MLQAFGLLLLALCVQQIAALDEVVDLGYAKYRGQKKDHVVSWKGMRYARSVARTDGRRFMAPEDPLPEREGSTIDANKFGPTCIGSRATLKTEFGDTQSEDCLFANIFAPADANEDAALPVYVFIQGGGFNENGNADYDGSNLIKASGGQMVIVNFNYRVGPYGFLAGKEIVDAQDLSLNNGLKDQRQLLKWVKTHISKFGGDPDHVTLGGASAGAGSVVLQLTAYSGRNDSLFQAVFAESPAFPPLRNVSASQFAYDALLQQSGCPDLNCLRNVDAVSFQNAVRALKARYPNAQGPPIYFWNPTLDYDFIADYTYNEIKADHLLKVPTVFGDTTNEGMVFTPKSITSQERAEQFLENQFTTFGPAEERLHRTDPARLQRMWAGPADLFFDAGWKKVASDLYGHIRYTCGSLNISSAYAAEGSSPSWHYRWNVGQALHVSELPNIWHGGKTRAGSLMQAYFVSFVRSWDPNKHVAEVLERAKVKQGDAGFPRWDEYEVGKEQRMVFSDDKTEMKDVSIEEKDKCSAITGMGVQLEQATLSPSSGTPHTRNPPFANTWSLFVYTGSIIVLAWWCGS